MNHLIPLVVTSLLSIGGCAATEQQPTSPPEGLTKAVVTPKLPGPGRAPDTVEIEDVGPYNMWAADEVRVCFGPDPFFSFDVSKPALADQPTMKNLIACMTNGPLQGKSIRLIGHTDPRGTEEYNERLGMQRAEKVKKFLVTNGIDAARILTATMGAEGAANAPKDWPQDRRVQIQVVH